MIKFNQYHLFILLFSNLPLIFDCFALPSSKGSQSFSPSFYTPFEDNQIYFPHPILKKQISLKKSFLTEKEKDSTVKMFDEQFKKHKQAAINIQTIQEIHPLFKDHDFGTGLNHLERAKSFEKIVNHIKEMPVEGREIDGDHHKHHHK